MAVSIGRCVPSISYRLVVFMYIGCEHQDWITNIVNSNKYFIQLIKYLCSFSLNIAYTGLYVCMYYILPPTVALPPI